MNLMHTYIRKKGLYQLAAADANHQYVFTTHSSTLINYPTPKSMYLVTKKAGQSSFSLLTDISTALSELGVSNQAFALADKVIFVEGPTEVEVLPMILAHYFPKTTGSNYKIIPLLSTGSEYYSEKLMKRNRKIYDAIFARIAATPIPYMILLDRDKRKKDMLQNIYGEKLKLMERREIENYLLDPDALCALFKLYDVTAPPDRIRDFVSKCLSSTDDTELFPKGCEIPPNDVKGSVV